MWVVLGSPGGHTHGDEGERKSERANEFHVGLLIVTKGLEGHVFDEKHRNTQASLALQQARTVERLAPLRAPAAALAKRFMFEAVFKRLIVCRGSKRALMRIKRN